MHWVGFATFVVRAYSDIVTHCLMTIAPPVVTTALYQVIFGSFVGERIGNMEGIAYQQFIVPGLILLPVITASYGQAGLSFVVAKLYRLIDEHLVSPQPSWIVVVSYVAGGVMRGVMAGAAAAVVTLIFTRVPVEHVWLALGTLLLVSLVSSAAGLINGVLANTLEQVSWVPSFVLTPLIYLGGVFYSVAQLPAWARAVSYANPIFYMVDLFRYCIFGMPDVHSGSAALAMLIAVLSMLGIGTLLIERGFGVRE